MSEEKPNYSRLYALWDVARKALRNVKPPTKKPFEEILVKEALQNTSAQNATYRTITHPDAVSIIQLIEEPAFDPWISWTVFHSYGRSVREIERMGQRLAGWNATSEAIEHFRRTLILKQLTWREDVDWEIVKHSTEDVANFQVHLDTLEVPIDRNQFVALMRRGSSISIPLIYTEYHGGNDGTIFSLRQPERYGFHLEWWGDGPQPWRELTGWAMELRTFFKEAVAQANALDTSNDQSSS